MKVNMIVFTLGAVLCSLAAAAPGSSHPSVKHKGLNCTSCHSSGQFSAPDKSKCLQCHQEEVIVKKGERFNFESTFTDPKTGNVSKQLVEINPHDNFHFGRTDQCINCHKEHTKSTVTCQTCHDIEPWGLKAPR